MLGTVQTETGPGRRSASPAPGAEQQAHAHLFVSVGWAPGMSAVYSGYTTYYDSRMHMGHSSEVFKRSQGRDKGKWYLSHEASVRPEMTGPVER